MWSALKLSIICAVAAVLLACTAGQGTAQPAATPSAPQASARAAWEEDWENTLREARKEGSVTVYTGYGADLTSVLAKAMQTKYGLNAEFVSARSAEIAERVMREQLSRTNMADVINIGVSQMQLALWPANALQPLKPVIIRPDVLDPAAWWQKRTPWVDRETATVFQMFAYANAPVAVNSDLVKPEEIKGYKDLLAPKWKGGIVLDDPTISGPGQQLMTMVAYSLMDLDYVRDFIKQEPALARDRTLQTQWLVRGKYPILVGVAPEQFYKLINEGAPVRFITPAEGAYVTPGFGCLAIPKAAPHPNAAKIFINFLLSQEGQTLASKALGLQSGRVDVPTDHLLPAQVRLPGVKYVSSTDEEFLAKEVDLKKRVVELFQPLMR
ncbi:MAG: extracellular solute-binding protein [Chloroflexi bacterium]|nr:extracellular solute-binding protein [Chloroflexota bacterium]